ncbi:MAG: phosphodiester glycosidase family protein [Armatimonadota bacterium]
MKRAALVVFIVVAQACSAPLSASGVVYQKQVACQTPVHVVYVDLNNSDVKVTVAISKAGRGSSEPAASIVSRTQPKAAITGTFFDTRSLLPTGDIVIAGVRAHSGCVGPALCISADNRAEIIPHKLRDRSRMSDYETVLAGGPSLVYNGQIALNPGAEGFKDPSLFRSTQRTAVGITAAHKIILVSVNRSVSMHRLAKIMLKLGSVQAMMLDGGSSTSLYANGRFLSKTSRKLTNLLLVYEKPEDYMSAIGQLAPTLVTEQQVIARADRPRHEAEDYRYEPENGSWSDILARSSKPAVMPFDLRAPGTRPPSTAWLSFIK